MPGVIAWIIHRFKTDTARISKSWHQSPRSIEAVDSSIARWINPKSKVKVSPIVIGKVDALKRDRSVTFFHLPGCISQKDSIGAVRIYIQVEISVSEISGWKVVRSP
jgi:hypothetical protein